MEVDELKTSGFDRVNIVRWRYGVNLIERVIKSNPKLGRNNILL